jgi:allantoinase
MTHEKFGLYSKNLVTPKGIKEGVLLIEGGTISGITDLDNIPAGFKVEDLAELVVMPGLVDSHVHINEPGRTDWEGFRTATRAAAAGGITTVADMPLNSNPVTTTLAAFQEKLEAAEPQLWVDCAFFGGVVPGNTASLEPMIEAGVVGFKCFLIHSGIDDFPDVSEADLRSAMPVLARHGVPLLVHAELEHAHDHKEDHADVWTNSRSYQEFLESRPRKWEDDAIGLMLRLCDELKCPVHIVHLSSSDMVPEIQRAIDGGARFTVETCPHYLTFASEEIPDGDTRFKCAPPIREKENREKLWAALRDGTIQIVVSDHSPCTPNLKFLEEGDLKKAWGGISSLQFRLPAVWTEAQKRGFSLNDIVEWLCKRPAEFLGMSKRKGSLTVGCDADIVVWDPHKKFKLGPESIEHKHKVTPYEGRELQGTVERTYLQGQLVFANGKVGAEPLGKILLRQTASVEAMTHGT